MSVDTVALWQGEFGTSYHQRNLSTPDEVRPVFEYILEGITPGTAYECGAGRGQNLAALRDMGWRVEGDEPNELAAADAKRLHGLTLSGLSVATDQAMAEYVWGLPDLVFTSGLLIHIPPDQIRLAMENLADVSKRYVLAIEYAAKQEEMQEYRGHRDILWRRPYGDLYQELGLKLLRHESPEWLLYPGCDFWLLEK